MSSPPPEQSFPVSQLAWLQQKRQQDGAEGLWRVHDKLYDLKDFISRHPGGGDWLTLTEGTDITELFESHHISEYPQKMLAKYYIRDANTKRNSPYTFEKDGFYNMLRIRVREELKTIPRSLEKKSQRVIEALFVLMLVFSLLIQLTDWLLMKLLLGFLASLCMTCVVTVGHNYIHKRDNWRMHLTEVGLISVWQWRIFHVMSHHMFPNTWRDLELTAYEPLAVFRVSHKSALYKASAWVSIHALYVFSSSFNCLYKWSTVLRGARPPCWADLLPLLVPLVMLLPRPPALQVLLSWLLVLHCSSLLTGLIGITAAHHHPDIYHEGDTPIAATDWGLHQLTSLMDRQETRGSFLRGLASYGEHALHHLFPTLDYALLDLLHPVVSRTCQEVGAEIRMTSQLDLTLGHYRQLLRTETKDFQLLEEKRQAGCAQKY